MKLINYISKNSIFYFILEIESIDEERRDCCILRIGAFKYYVALRLPTWVLNPYKEYLKSVKYNYDYVKIHPNVYGISITYDGVRLSYGPSTFDSKTTKSKYFIIPWNDYTYVSTTYYDLYMNVFGQVYGYNCSDEQLKLEKDQPAIYFKFLDFDDEPRLAKCTMSRRLWTKGSGKFKWLKYLCKDINNLYLDIVFDQETGYQKGSYKGGILQTNGITKFDNHYAAFLDYAEKNNFKHVEQTSEQFKDYRY